ncbi:hypothetical protein [Streptomyces sp. NPDC094032]|uniref:hypothetical protein n=1 Tax=Streptomyces sp. NPDC094032 TaxID=3155308 RepID=UPI003322C76F
MTFGQQMARVATPVVGSLALLAAGMATAPTEAEAAPLGRVCMFLAPDGAYGAGHAAFAFKVRGEKDHWMFGSFGSTTDSPRKGWIKGGTWKKARAHFTNVKDGKARYYTGYRCVNTRDGDVKRAQSWYTTVKNRGYNVTTNNCLHMSMAAFKGYSETLRKDTRLRTATGQTPNVYYKSVLDKAKWEKSHRLDDRPRNKK